MIAMPRHLLVGSICMLAALGIASCSTDETGSSLEVTAVDHSPLRVPGNSEVDANPIIVYKGDKELSYSWTLISSPPSALVGIDGINKQSPTFTFGDLGTYTFQLRVYENAGTLERISTGSYIVTSFAQLIGQATAPAISGAPSNSGFISGSSSLQATASGGKSPYAFSWTVPTRLSGSGSASLSSTTSAASTMTVTGAVDGSQFQTILTITDSQTPAQSVVIPVTVAVAATSSG